MHESVSACNDVYPEMGVTKIISFQVLDFLIQYYRSTVDSEFFFFWGGGVLFCSMQFTFLLMIINELFMFS
jgi:hypothetical protein